MNLPQVIMTGVLFLIMTLRGTLDFIPDLVQFQHTASCFLLDIPYLALALDNIHTMFLGQDLGATHYLRLTCQAYDINGPKDEILISVVSILGNSNLHQPQCPIDSAPISTSIPICDVYANSTLSVEPLSVLPLVQVSLVETSTPADVLTPLVTVASVPSALVSSVSETKAETHDSTTHVASPLSGSPHPDVGHCTLAERDLVVAHALKMFLLVMLGLFVIVRLRNPEVKIVSPFLPVIDGTKRLSLV